MNYKLFGKSGLRISELCLGTMNFGDQQFLGIDKAASRTIFDAFVDAGGNYIDTANNYTDGVSEQYVGEFIRHDRDRFVVSTKYSGVTADNDANAFGNARKNMVRAVERSLKALNTDYIDIYWVHNWDFMTPAQEITRGLNDLVSSGKILYFGLSNAPSWLLAQCNTLAELNGQQGFCGMQLEYSLAQRSIEAEFFPLLEAFDLNLSAWSPLAGGILSGKYQQGSSDQSSRFNTLQMDVSQTHAKLLAKATDIAAEVGCSLPQLALAWIRHRNPRITPVIGASKPSQLEDNIGSLQIKFSTEQFNALLAASQPTLQEPYGILNRAYHIPRMFGEYRNRIDNHRFTFPG